MAGLAIGSAGPRAAEESPEVAARLRRLEEQNRVLQEQLRRQSGTLEQLQRKIAEMGGAQAREPLAQVESQAEAEARNPPGLLTRQLSGGRVVLGGEGGLAFFHQPRDGQFGTAEFRVDEARLFLDARVWKEVYFFAELNLVTREEPDEYLALGELYLDFENVSRLWGTERLLNVRVGRFDIPFGEEYSARDAVDNPLISHSLSDLWGIDEGVALYGSWAKSQYVLAVQNGSHPSLRDFDNDKAWIARLGVDPARWLHVSVSGMRTGHIDPVRDQLTELWFGNGLIRSLGSTNGTTRFQANVLEGDLEARWHRGQLKSAGGWLTYDDNDTKRDNSRDVYYYYIEATQDLSGKLYAAGRWSHLLAPMGFPLVGAGPFGRRLFGTLTEELWRLSLGLGYRFSRDLLLKVEYTFNHGRELGGQARNREDFFGAEAAFRF